MIKKHLLALIDIRLIIFLVVIIAVSVILTMVFSDKIKDFAVNYKKKFYSYVFSFVLIYALVAFLGYNKLFTELSDEFLFYQIASLLFGTIHVYLYRWYFEEFKVKTVGIELLFSLLIILYSSVLFIIIYTALNGIALTLLMCSHFLVFVIPTGIYVTFNYMMQIPPKEYVTWKIKTGDNPYPEVEDVDMKDLLLITLLVQKKSDSISYTSLRSKGPVRIDFGNLFYHTVTGYNAHNSQSPIDLLDSNGGNCNWVFFLQPKWYQSAKYVDAVYTLGMNGITENSVIICRRQKAKEELPDKKSKLEDPGFMYEPKPKKEKENEKGKKPEPAQEELAPVE
ncbi:TssN family type VI secretion system protein [Flavobacterium sp. LS1R49]|uniref:TssN family type VI secretion system protein n=1 Tax=Flavobacterium shii TaxID=2987687 RepID=A0A9X2Z9Q6_9FLAO|nr:TssN family type VI secretion system protein [Flavobacterium shii]MCV9926941.1 TssN family type VI secretion system protein [Flavobacterium shii]